MRTDTGIYGRFKQALQLHPPVYYSEMETTSAAAHEKRQKLLRFMESDPIVYFTKANVAECISALVGKPMIRTTEEYNSTQNIVVLSSLHLAPILKQDSRNSFEVAVLKPPAKSIIRIEKSFCCKTPHAPSLAMPT